jgi:hypothetical protein
LPAQGNPESGKKEVRHRTYQARNGAVLRSVPLKFLNGTHPGHRAPRLGHRPEMPNQDLLWELLMPWRLLAGWMLAALVTTAASAADPRAYGPRGDCSEGIRIKPIAGRDIELISALADTAAGPVQGMPRRLRLWFFLPAGESPRINVRELDNRHFYWLDRVRRPWNTGAINVFDWPTIRVIRQIRGLVPRHLGALVRLGADGSGARERVAPAVLSGTNGLEPIVGYRFTFKTGGPAHMVCRLFPLPSSEGTPLWEKAFPRVDGGRAFTCRVPADRVGRGPHRLVLSGYSLRDSAPIRQLVDFAPWPTSVP